MGVVLLKTASERRVLLSLYSITASSNAGALVACGPSKRKSVSATSSLSGVTGEIPLATLLVTARFVFTVVWVVGLDLLPKNFRRTGTTTSSLEGSCPSLTVTRRGNTPDFANNTC